MVILLILPLNNHKEGLQICVNLFTQTYCLLSILLHLHKFVYKVTTKRHNSKLCFFFLHTQNRDMIFNIKNKIKEVYCDSRPKFFFSYKMISYIIKLPQSVKSIIYLVSKFIISHYIKPKFYLCTVYVVGTLNI